MVIDIGGGTVDITVQDQRADKVSVVLTPIGNAWGGTTVNKAFSDVLGEIVDDKEFEGFLSRKAVHKAILNKLLYSEFEDEKRKFGDKYKAVATASDELIINLPSSFVDYYRDKIRSRVRRMEGVDFEDEDDALYIKYGHVEKRLFQPTIDGIVKCTFTAFKELKERVDTIYLVGGFGGCQYIYKKLEEAIRRYHGVHYDKIVCPEHPNLAIATGAVMWRKNPGVIESRKADATYGIAVSIPFIDGEHEEHYRFYNEEQQQYRCDDVFCVFLQKGELAKADEVFTTDLTPGYQRMTTISLTIYTTPNLGVQYVEDEEGRATVRKIGELEIDIPNPDNLPREERIVDVTMDFSSTEIQAKAKYRVNGQEVKTVCDFLSAQI